MPPQPMPIRRDKITLALAWMRGDLTTQQVRDKLGYTQTTQTVYKMGAALRAAYQRGLIKEPDDKQRS